MTERDVDALRAAWAAAPATAPGPECAAPDAIWEAAQGNRPDAEVRAMLAHSLGCADCSALWRLARELSAAGAEAGAPAPVIPLARFRPARWLVGAGALAAAAVLAFVLLPRSGMRETPPILRGVNEPMLRPAPDAGLLSRTHPVLRWTGAPYGSRYSVVVSTRDLTVLYRKSGLNVPELEIPAEALSGVPAGADLVWRVEAIAPGGRRLSSGAFLSRLE
ncbi:MAG: hypothetical protein ACXWLF_03380 [Myxococcaceae bacterium]